MSRPVPKSLLESVLGSSISNEMEALSGDTVNRVIELKIEQEKTKQQYYKLENTNKSIEFFKLASSYGLPPSHISTLFNDNTSNKDNNILATNSSNITNQQEHLKSYKFPPVMQGNTIPSKSMISKIPHRRTNSPARIGANAVAALSDKIVIKEENSSTLDHLQESPLIKRNITQQHRNGNNSQYQHNRNLSLPAMNKFTNYPIPTAMTSILSFNSTAQTHSLSPQPQPQTEATNREDVVEHESLKKPTFLAPRRHRRAKSASSFGVIDLNVIEEAQSNNVDITVAASCTTGGTTNSDKQPLDDDTCSESSSRHESPIRPPTHNSVEKLLNN